LAQRRATSQIAVIGSNSPTRAPTKEALRRDASISTSGSHGDPRLDSVATLPLVNRDATRHGAASP
jgi:hypothetical protein